MNWDADLTGDLAAPQKLSHYLNSKLMLLLATFLNGVWFDPLFRRALFS